MTLYVNEQNKAAGHNATLVFLKNASVPKVTVPGKVVSVDTDNYSVSITTETHFAVFDTKDVAGIMFE